MAIAVLNPLFISISGRIGNIVFYRRKKTQCIRTYVVPRNPNSVLQRNIRRSFADAVNSWQALTALEKYKYARKTRGTRMSGYNLYISEYMKKNIVAHSKHAIKSLSRNLVNPDSLPQRIHSVSASIFSRSHSITAAKELCHSRGQPDIVFLS